jgi:hypothetical protein
MPRNDLLPPDAAQSNREASVELSKVTVDEPPSIGTIRHHSAPVGAPGVVCAIWDGMHRTDRHAHRGVWVRTLDSGSLDQDVFLYARPCVGSSLLPGDAASHRQGMNQQ